MLRFSSLWVLLACVGCGGSSFDIPAEQGEFDSGTPTGDSSATTDSSTSPTDSNTTTTDSTTTGDTATATDTIVAMDTTVPPMDAPCTAPGSDATDIYVDASVATTGKGGATCPFKTIIEAAIVPRNPTTVRVIHVKAGTYAESDIVNISGTVTLKSEGGTSKLSGGSKGACGTPSDKCIVRLEGPSVLDGFDVDATGVTIGVVIASGGKILNTTISKSARDGVLAQVGGELGPEIHVDDNAFSGVVVRGGNLKVNAGTNSFDRNKGTGTFSVPAGGIVLYNNATLEFQGGSASENQTGIMFDWSTASSTSPQNINKLVAKNNRVGGITIPQNQSKVVIRNSVLTKNGQYGVWFSYNTSSPNKLDIGDATTSGGNTFGGGSDKNGKVGIFLCRSGATSTQPGEGNSWSVCPPIQLPASNCDSWPTSYADVGYVPASSVGTTAGLNPVAATKCTVGP